MTDFQRVEVRGWEYDLHSVYSAYLGHFQLHGIPWYDRSWGHLFESFAEFLTFSWPVVVVTDAKTGKAHIVTRIGSVGAFVKMVKTRFGETLPTVDNMFVVTPLEASPRRLHTVTDWATYRKLHATLNAAVLAALKARVRGGDPTVIQELWGNRDKTFLAVDFEWSERNPSSVLEWGYAAMRCGHLHAVDSWPPDPETNYRKGHYIVSEYVDKVHNKHTPNYPWQYSFGESQMVSKARLPMIMQAVISLTTPDSETIANTVVLVGHGISGNLSRIEEMKITLPSNMLVIDTAVYERRLFASGLRGAMIDAKTGQPRAPGSTLSLESTLRSLGLGTHAPLHNAGNDAYLTLLALQLLLDPSHTAIPRAAAAGGTARPAVRTPQPLPVLQMPGGRSGHSPARAGSGGTPPLRYSGVFTSSPALSPHAHTPSPGAPGTTPPVRYSGYLSASPSGSPALGHLKGPTDDYFVEGGRQGGTSSNRNSRRLSSFIPDEMGNLRERKTSGSGDQLSRSMRNMTVG